MRNSISGQHPVLDNADASFSTEKMHRGDAYPHSCLNTYAKQTMLTASQPSRPAVLQGSTSSSKCLQLKEHENGTVKLYISTA